MKNMLFVFILILAACPALAENNQSEQPMASDLKVHFVSPFKVAPNISSGDYVSYESRFRTGFKRRFEQSDYSKVFTDTLKKIMRETGLCNNGNTDPASRLQKCFNEQPDEAATLANMVDFYIRWKSSEIDTVVKIFLQKASSSKMAERIEAKLFFNCMHEMYSSNVDIDASSALETCKEPRNWDLSSLWPELNNCSRAFAQQSSVATFKFRDYVRDCIAEKFLENFQNNYGAQTAINLLLDLEININGSRVVSTFYPFEVQPKIIFDAIKERVLEILNSEWYTKLATKGCIPSIFTPLGSNSQQALEATFSVCVPPKIVQKIAALPVADAKFFRDILSTKIAVLQTLELLYGASMIAQEAQRQLAVVDTDLAQFAKYNTNFIETLARLYKDSIDIAYTTTLEDILASVEELFAMYAQEKEAINDAASVAASELARQKQLVLKGSDSLY